MSQQEYDIFICNCQTIAKSKGFDFSVSFLSKTPTHQVIQMYKRYLENVSTVGQAIADLSLQQTLVQKLSQMKQIPKDMQMIFVKKQREQQNDLKIEMALKNARSKFFNKQSNSETQGFKSIKEIKQFFCKKYSECLPIKIAMEKKITTLKVIYIEYELLWHYKYRYLVTAFELFKFVHENMRLTEVTLKGVYVSQFNSFLKRNRELKQNKEKFKQRNNSQEWIEGFNPLKSLKLSINTQLSFYVQDQSFCLSRLRDFVLFRQMVSELSDITIKIKLGDFDSIQEVCAFQNLLRQIRSIKKIKIIMTKFQFSSGFKKDTSQPKEAIPTIRSVLFGGLASFTEITSLCFQCIEFNPKTNINDFLGMESSLMTLFENNPISHLQIENCENFPLLPQIQTLKHLHLDNIKFRRSVDLLSEVGTNNSQLKSLSFSQVLKHQIIEEQLLNRLQTFIANQGFSKITMNINPHSPSKIKHLVIEKRFLEECDYLNKMLPKLIHLTYWQSTNININHQLLCTIPSPDLKDLHIYKNQSITKQGLREINLKWPQLKNLTLQTCRKLYGDVWQICNFKGLMNVKLDGVSVKIVQQLRRRGIMAY